MLFELRYFKKHRFCPLTPHCSLCAVFLRAISLVSYEFDTVRVAEWCMEKLGTAAQNMVETYLFSPLQSMIIIAKDKPDFLKPYAAFLEKLQANPAVQQIAKQAIDFMNGTNVDDVRCRRACLYYHAYFVLPGLLIRNACCFFPPVSRDLCVSSVLSRGQFV